MAARKQTVEIALSRIVRHLKYVHHYTDSDIKRLVEGKGAHVIPSNIFSAELSSFETIVKYLHENKDMRLKDIANLLHKSSSTIWITYRNSARKNSERLPQGDFTISITPESLTHGDLSILEGISWYLKEHYGLQFHKIAQILRRDDRTIWTAWNRASQKLKKRGVNA